MNTYNCNSSSMQWRQGDGCGLLLAGFSSRSSKRPHLKGIKQRAMAPDMDIVLWLLKYAYRIAHLQVLLTHTPNTLPLTHPHHTHMSHTHTSHTHHIPHIHHISHTIHTYTHHM